MVRYSPYRNIFVYFRGATKSEEQADKQLEDNITKALINFLEYSDKPVLKKFLKKNSIEADVTDIHFDLQVANTESRPDALIRTGKKEIYIESKFGAPFDQEQLINHKNNTDGFLLYISRDKYDKQILDKHTDSRTIFINWIDIAAFVKKEILNCFSEDSVTQFLAKQYIAYMEELNMVPFSGWSNRDFEAFLPTDTDNQKLSEEERKRVKIKLDNFLTDIQNKIKQNNAYFANSTYKIGNLDKEHVWGSIKFTDDDLINQVHISIIMNSTTLSFGIQIEGNRPSKIAIEKIKNDKPGFLDIISKLDDYIFVIRKRFQIRASIWDSSVAAQIVLGNELTEDDVNYIALKLERFNYVELRIVKIYHQHEAIQKGEDFIQECVESIEKLTALIDFLK